MKRPLGRETCLRINLHQGCVVDTRLKIKWQVGPYAWISLVATSWGREYLTQERAFQRKISRDGEK